MTDPFSLITGIIGVAAVTVHTARRLKECLDSIKEGPETIKSISKELGTLQYSLISLEDLLRGGDDFFRVAQTDEGVRCVVSLAQILTHCQQNLNSIDNTVKPFVEKRDGSREQKWKAVIGWTSQKNTLDSLKRELVNAKMTLDLCLSLATFLITRSGISQLQTQFTQLNTRLEQEASEDNMSDVGSSSVVTDLGFALRRFLREPDTGTVSSNLITIADGRRRPTDLIKDDFGWHSWKKVGDNGFVSIPRNSDRPQTGRSFDSKEVCPNISSPPDSPLAKRTTFDSLQVSPPTSPVTSFTIFSSQPAEQWSKKPGVERRTTDPLLARRLTSIQHGRPPEHLSLKPAPPRFYDDDTGWENFQIPLEIFSKYFDLSFKKLMKSSPTSMINFGIVIAEPISNSSAYINSHADSGGDKNRHLWDHMKDPKLYRRSGQHCTLQIPKHKVSGKPPTKGVSRVSLSKFVTNGSSYEFIRLFIMAQRPLNNTAYNFQWKPFCVFEYISHPKRNRDIGTDDESTEDSGTKTTPDATPASFRMAIKDEMLTFRLKTSDDKRFLDPSRAYWSLDPSVGMDWGEGIRWLRANGELSDRQP